jgi:hypoxanthine phosphoribosyltransferase
VFVADLARALDGVGCHPRVEFITLSSYGCGRESAGAVRLIGELPEGVAGRAVLLVDDVADTGRSLAFARDLLLGQGAARVWICALVDKPSRREVEIAVDFTGFTVGDRFVVGYGIDYAEQPLRGRLRHRLRRAIPPPALHRRDRLNPQTGPCTHKLQLAQRRGADVGFRANIGPKSAHLGTSESS